MQNADPLLSDEALTHLDMTQLERVLVSAIPTLTGRVKHIARNAVHSLNLAYMHLESDTCIAGFRAITAEEESVSAVFLALKNKRYTGAEKLQWENHRHKAAFHSMTQSIYKWSGLVESLGVKMRFTIDTNGVTPRAKVELEVKDLRALAEVIPPLDFNFKVDGKITFFEKQLAELESERNVECISDDIKERANIRNRLLYASPEGVPTCESEQMRGSIRYNRSRVFANLFILLLIDQTNRPQLFAQQALDTLLVIIRRLGSKKPQASH